MVNLWLKMIFRARRRKERSFFFWNLKVKVICKTKLLLIFKEIDILLKRMRTNISNNLYPQFWSEDFFNIEYEDIQIFRSIRSSEITWNKL